MELSNWAPEHSDALREFIAKGMSFSEAARAINSRFNTSYSRNAALGRATAPGAAGRTIAGQPSMRKPSRQSCAKSLLQASSGRCASLADAGVQRIKPIKLRCVADRAAASLPDRAGARRLPLSLWRRRRGRGHHLLRPSAPPGFELLHAAFSSEPRSDRAAERTVSTVRCGWWRRHEERCRHRVADRLKRLPRRHRIAHLRALIGLQPEGCGRRDELSELLRDEMSDASIE